MVKASKIMHHNEPRILFDFPYNLEIINKIRQIEGSRWSKTYKGWHVPYTKEVFSKLLKMFPDLDYPKKGITAPVICPIPEKDSKIKIEDNYSIKNKKISVEVFIRKILIQMPKIEADVAFIKNHCCPVKPEYCYFFFLLA